MPGWRDRQEEFSFARFPLLFLILRLPAGDRLFSGGMLGLGITDLVAHLGRHFVGGLAGGLAQLQRANIRGNLPAIHSGNLRGIFGHGSIAIGHDIKEVSDRSLDQPWLEKVSRPLVAALHDHAVSIAYL